MNYNGILLVDKPEGLTSHDIVDFIRRSFGFEKVGHAGTLDPMASGLLILLLGSFTKKSAQISNYDKEYEGVLCLGVSTDTADREGKITEKKDLAGYAEEIKKVERVFGLFKGKQFQTPPMYSAKKIKGKKLYELARKGVVIEREPREIFISDITVKDMTLPHVTFMVKCSKGTYVRQLAEDIGHALGTGGHLSSLRRTRIGTFSVEDAVTLDRLKAEKKIFYENILQPS